MFKKGDRIRLVSLDDDPDPVPVGTEGTVEYSQLVCFPDSNWVQVGVAWDNGRSLSLCIPPDHAVKVS